jgi:hypothetical protein
MLTLVFREYGAALQLPLGPALTSVKNGFNGSNGLNGENRTFETKYGSAMCRAAVLFAARLVL